MKTNRGQDLGVNLVPNLSLWNFTEQSDLAHYLKDSFKLVRIFTYINYETKSTKLDTSVIQRAYSRSTEDIEIIYRSWGHSNNLCAHTLGNIFVHI